MSKKINSQELNRVALDLDMARFRLGLIMEDEHDHVDEMYLVAIDEEISKVEDMVKEFKRSLKKRRMLK